MYAHYQAYGRHQLPWRHTTDPYCIYVSEVMLQQTQVPRVIEKYPAFVGAFASWKALATAPLDRVLAAWQGLGYNRRAKFLHLAAARVVGEHDGVLPDDPAVLATLPGIGPATAASIATFAFNRPTVFIETNIRAVFIHHFFEGREGVGDDEILPLVKRTLDSQSPGRWYSALMDYGTSLKKAHGNPARRSRHHVRQSRFEGSDRQIRGAILRQLLEAERMGATALAQQIGTEPERLERIAGAMAAEGLIQMDRGVYWVRT